MVWFAIFVILLTLIGLGCWEHRWHRANLESIPLRIMVNGSRGKSTITRLIVSILREHQLRVLGKTTGSAARVLYWFSDEERSIERRVLGANIGEQKTVVAEAASWGAEVLVTECMALKPSYQRVFQEKYTKAQWLVITNVLEDHLDVMGPTVADAANVFARTIPHGGTLVIAPGPFADLFCAAAEARGTRVVVAEPERIDEMQLKSFTYGVFAENVALALAVSDALHIDRETAWRGLLAARPDPGAMRWRWLSECVCFVNGFAANDPQSALAIWRRAVELGIAGQKLLVIINCRADRMDRTRQFVHDVLPHLPIDLLVATGTRVDPVSESVADRNVMVREYSDMEDSSVDEVLTVISAWQTACESEGERGLVLGLCNIYGAGERLLERVMSDG